LPTAFGESDGVAIVFGENGRYVTEEQLKRGVILDAQAARILISRGIDVGINSMNRKKPSGVEYYYAQNEYTLKWEMGNPIVYGFELKHGARVLSEFVEHDVGLGVNDGYLSNKNRYPACYLYENAEGMRFMVYSFYAAKMYGMKFTKSGRFTDYCRQRQVADGIEWLGGKKLPAMTFKNPHLYTLCKRDGNKLSVGLWNIFEDEVLNPVIELDGEYASVDFYNCSGRLEGNKVVLDGEIAPFGFALFTVTKDE
jgi:hypothetical protein